MRHLGFGLPAVCGWFCALLVLTTCASAATVTVSVDTNNTISGHVANAIIADGEGIDWTGGAILLELTGGSVYNNALGSNDPLQAFWGVFPELEWDTWFGIPGDSTGEVGGTLGDLGCLSCGPNTIGPTAIYHSYFNTRTTDTSSVRVANVSLSADAQGTWSMIHNFAGGLFVRTEGTVVNGVMLPEPGVWGIITAACVVSVQRRRP